MVRFVSTGASDTSVLASARFIIGAAMKLAAARPPVATPLRFRNWRRLMPSPEVSLAEGVGVSRMTSSLLVTRIIARAA